MTGQRHLRNAALIIGALGAMPLLWLAIHMASATAPPVWWLEAAFYGLLVFVAIRLMKGSDLAWFGAVLVFGGAGVIGLEAALDLAFSSAAAGIAAIVRAGGLLAAGAYGLWALLLSEKVRAFRALHGRRDRFPLALSTLAGLAIACGIGWYLDRLSPEIQRTLATQLGIAGLFAALVGFLAARNRGVPVRWEFLPLVMAAIALIANLESIAQLRALRTMSQALAAAQPDRAAAMAQSVSGQARAITNDLQRAKDRLLAGMEAQTAAAAPWHLATVLGPATITNPAAIDRAAADAGGLLSASHRSLQAMEVLLTRFAEQRRRIVSPLPDPVRRRIETGFEQEENAYRSHYGARINLLSRASANLVAMLQVLGKQAGRYTADWSGRPVFQDSGAAADYETSRAALEELKVWDARLRAEGAALAAGKPAWGWLRGIN